MAMSKRAKAKVAANMTAANKAGPKYPQPPSGTKGAPGGKGGGKARGASETSLRNKFG